MCNTKCTSRAETKILVYKYNPPRSGNFPFKGENVAGIEC